MEKQDYQSAASGYLLSVELEVMFEHILRDSVISNMFQFSEGTCTGSEQEKGGESRSGARKKV